MKGIRKRIRININIEKVCDRTREESAGRRHLKEGKADMDYQTDCDATGHGEPQWVLE